MPNLNRITNTSTNRSSCGGCRGGACSACQSCPSCTSDRQGARDTLSRLQRLVQQDPAGTQSGVDDAFRRDGGLANNAILMKILGLLGLQAPAQG